MHVAIPIYGKAVTDAGTVRCHAGMLTLPRRHGNVVTPAWQRCYAGVATDKLPCRNGKAPYKNEYMPDRIGYISEIQRFIYLRFPTLFSLSFFSCYTLFNPLFIPLSSPILRMQFLRGERLLGDKNKSRFSRAHVAYEKSGMG